MLFPILVDAVLGATVLLGVALLVRRIARDRLPAETRFRIVLVTALSLPLLAVGPGLQALADGSSGQEGRGLVVPSGASSVAPGAGAPPVDSRRAIRVFVPAGVARIVVLAWAALAAACAARIVAVRAAALMRVRRMRPCTDPRWLRPFEKLLVLRPLRHLPRLLDGGGSLPFTAGPGGRFIAVPSGSDEWTESERRAVLLHELAHVERRDVTLMLGAELVAALFWCVPFMGAALRALVEDREEACDGRVVAEGVGRAEYAGLILELTAGRAQAVPGTSGIVHRPRNGRRLERRISMIITGTNATSRRRGIRACAAVCVAVVFLVLVGLPPVFAVDTGSTATGPAPEPVIARMDLATLPCLAPVDGEWRVTNPFGRQKNAITGAPYFHTGIDLTNRRSGSPVHATLPGQVTAAGFDTERGNYVVVSRGDVEVRFLKLKSIAVAVGDTVTVGEVIGKVGSTGLSTGPHLHYEVTVGGAAVDPAPLLRAGGARYAGL